MERWLEFKVRYVHSINRVVIRLVEMTKGENDHWPRDREVGEDWFTVYSWWHSIRDIENAVAKAKTRLYDCYKKTAVFTTAIELVCESNSGIKIPVNDPQTERLIRKYTESKKD